MSEWRHAGESVTGVCWDCASTTEEGCTTPTPDPSSPCGACDLPDASRVHMPETMAWDHPHIPTRCQCGHPIEPVR